MHDAEEKIKRHRGANYSQNERLELISIATNYLQVIENKKTDTATVRLKQGTWAEIADIFNTRFRGGTARTIESLKKCYDNIKTETRKEAAAQKQRRCKIEEDYENDIRISENYIPSIREIENEEYNIDPLSEKRKSSWSSSFESNRLAEKYSMLADMKIKSEILRADILQQKKNYQAQKQKMKLEKFKAKIEFNQNKEKLILDQLRADLKTKEHSQLIN